MNRDDEARLRQVVYDALMKIAENTNEHPAAVLLEALSASVMTLTALEKHDHVDRIYRLAVNAGHQLRRELERQYRADQATLVA
jgi:hypothetical protein